MWLIVFAANKIKEMDMGPFQYRLDALKYGRWGGIWEAPHEYSFVNQDNSQTQVKQIEVFDDIR